METTDLFRKAEATLREANKRSSSACSPFAARLLRPRPNHLGAKKSIDWEDAKSDWAAKHAFERYSAVSLAVQDVSGVVSAATAALRSLDLHGAEWEVYACRNDLAPESDELETGFAGVDVRWRANGRQSFRRHHSPARRANGTGCLFRHGSD